MGILDGIVEWIAEQVMNILDLITSSVLGALGCSMDTFLRYFPAAETMYQVFLALGIGLILLNWVWQLFKNYFMGAGIEAEDPIKLSIRSFLFIFLTFYAKDIVDLLLKISGTPYNWILTEDLPPLKFADFNSVVTVILGVCANGAVAIIALILVLILAWNYIKLLFEAAERYILLGVLVYTAPAAFSMGASQSTGNIFKSWCRMLGGQFFLLLMNAWCLRLFTSMVGTFLANPLSLQERRTKMKLRKKLIPFLVLTACLVLFCSMPVFAAELTEADVEAAVASQGKEAVTGNVFVWFLCAIAFLKVSQKIDSFLASLGINVGNTGGNMMAELLIAGRSLTGSMRSHGGGGYHKASSPGSAAVAGSFLSGGLAGAVGRQVQREAVNSATGYTEHSSIGNMLYQSSLNKGGDFANQVISNIALGNYGQVGSIKGADAQKAFTSYMGINPGGGSSYDNVEIGGGRITGTETGSSGNRDFALYHADQYAAPTQGSYSTVQSVDGSTWYKQYAQDTVEKTPYTSGSGKVAYNESIVQKLPPAPQRKERM